MNVTIDPYSGFCFGVERAIRMAGEELQQSHHLLSLGQLVHNDEETSRLEREGLEETDMKGISRAHGSKVIFRAHGEPPSSYELARDNGLEVIDATCPIVSRLQEKISKTAQEMLEKDGMVIIYGREQHPEVIGLLGYGEGLTHTVNSASQLDGLALKPIVRVFAQTTMEEKGYLEMISHLENLLAEHYPREVVDVRSFNTICRQVSGRESHLRKFAEDQDVVVFVSGKHSSNGRNLFGICKSANPSSHWISRPDELRNEWFSDSSNVGVSGATSTPAWLIKEVAEKIGEM